MEARAKIINNKNETEFRVIQDIPDSIVANTTAELTGIFNPSTAGNKELMVSFKYDQNQEEVKVTAKIEVIAAKLALTLIKPDRLPDKLPRNHIQPIEFLIKNTTEFDTTQISIKETEGLDEGLIFEEKPTAAKDGSYEQVAKAMDIASFNTLKTKLDPLNRLRIQGNIKLDKKISKSVKILVDYAELKYLTDADKKEAEFSKTIQIEDIIIKGWASIPSKIRLGTETNVIFNFKNEHLTFPATGIMITVSKKDEVIVALSTEELVFSA